MPEPDPDSEAQEILKLLGLTKKEDVILVLAWAVTTMVADIPRPVLMFHGPQAEIFLKMAERGIRLCSF